MDKKTFGAVLLLVGIGVLVNFMLADGIGIGNHPDFGHRQIIGTAVGAILTAGGLFLMTRQK